MIRDILLTMEIPADDGTEWDVPTHIIGSGFRLAVIDEDVLGQAQIQGHDDDGDVPP
jgi:hypothetical protein